MMKPFSVLVQGWLLAMIPAVVQAGHHPRHTGSPAALWIFLGIIAFVGIMVLATRKRK